MALWREVVRSHPSVRDYIRNRRWSRRGDVVTYAANQRHETFSTDATGFRHSVFQSREFGIRDCLAADRYGLVMGSSHVFGFGLASNASTLPSQLGAKLGFPFGNVSFPEADTRTLHAVLTNILYTQSLRPCVVVLCTGGDFTRHAFSAEADPVFGSRNLEDAAASEDPQKAMAAAARSVPAALTCSALWTRALIDTARAAGVPVVLVNDVTFMEKTSPSREEKSCGLGNSGAPDQIRRFEHQRRFGPAFFEMRSRLASVLQVRHPGLHAQELNFIDEFHYDAAAIDRLADIIASDVKTCLTLD